MATGDDDDDDVHGMQRLCPARVPPVSRPCPARVRQTKASHKSTPEAMSIMNGDEDEGDEGCHAAMQLPCCVYFTRWASSTSTTGMVVA